MSFDDSSQRVLERFEEHVGQMAGHIHKLEVGRTEELDFRGIEQTKMVFAHESRILDGLLCQVLYTCLRADDAHVVGVFVGGLIRQRNVLPNKHTYTNTRHVESVKEGLYRGVDLHALLFSFPLIYALCNGGDDWVMSSFYVCEASSKLAIVLGQHGRPVLAII